MKPAKFANARTHSLPQARDESPAPGGQAVRSPDKSRKLR
jgi:hypothetical protein